MLTSGKSSYQGKKKWLRFSSVLTAASKQKYAKNKITWQLDQTNISITHVWKKKTENKLWLSGVFLPSHKIWAINSNSIVWGFPIFSLAALSNKLISCGELGMFLVCHVFFFFLSFFQTHKYRPSSPRGINQRQHCQVLRSCACASLFILEDCLFLFQFH